MYDLVVDASITAAWCFPNEHTQYSNGVLRAVGTTFNPIAPSLWAYEVRNLILTGIKRERITRQVAQGLLGFLKDLNVRLIDPVSYDSVFDVAERYKLTVYDAAYLDLAARQGAPLVSLDKALCKAALTAGIILFEAPHSA